MVGRVRRWMLVAGGALAVAPGAAAAATSDAGDVPAVAAHYGISEAAAAERLRLDELAGALEGDARARWPETFAGLWIDHEGGGAISVAFTRDAPANVAELAAGFARPLLLRPVTARRSLRQLAALQDRVAADRGRERAALGIDQARNVVTLTVERPTAALAADVARRYGDAVAVREGAPAVAQCSRSSCAYSLRAGMWTDGPSGYCSTGFTVRRMSTGVRDILSAGHCGGTDRLHTAIRYGGVQQSQNAGAVDAERISVGNGFSARAWIWISSSERTRSVTGRNAYDNLAVGSTVCKSGVTTGHTCGKVVNKDYRNLTSYITDPHHFVEVDNMCSRRGDSGGPVYINGTAVGIHSGGDPDNTCGDAGDFAVFSHIQFIESAMDAVVWTQERPPEFTSASRVDDNRITVRFTLPVECSTVQPQDFAVHLAGIPILVDSTNCSHYSDSAFTLTTKTPVPTSTELTVSVNGAMTDPDGNSVPKVTRDAT